MNSAWVKHAISEINADYQRSADTHLIRLPLPAFPGIHLYLKDESTHPTGSLEASPGAVAVSLWLVQRLDQRRHANYRVLLRVNRRFGGLFRPPAGAAVYRCDALLHRQAQNRTDRVLRRTLSFLCRAPAKSTRLPKRWPAS